MRVSVYFFSGPKTLERKHQWLDLPPPHLDPISLIFMQFAAKILSNSRMAHSATGVGTPSLKISGSATAAFFPFNHLLLISSKGS